MYRLVEKSAGSQQPFAGSLQQRASLIVVMQRAQRREAGSLASLEMTGSLNESEKGLLRKAHQTLRRVTARF